MNAVFKPVGHQISVVKFISDYNEADPYFVVGSQMEINNSISLYRCSKNVEDSEPELIDKVNHAGDVTCVDYNIHHNRIVSCSSSGCINIYETDKNGKIKLDVGWDNVTKAGASISGILLYNDHIVCVSESCEILGINLNTDMTRPQDLFRFRSEDGSALTCVSGVGADQFVSGSEAGIVRLWDSRSGKDPVWSGRGSSSILCLASHPDLPHLLASGSSSGMLQLWDLRVAAALPVSVQSDSSPGPLWAARYRRDSSQELLLASGKAGLLSVAVDQPRHWLAPTEHHSQPQLRMTTLLGTDSAATSVFSLDLSAGLALAASDKEILCLLSI